MLIYHITTAADWDTPGDYRADSLVAQGFIHFSTREQVARVANAVYTARRDLVLLVVDADRLRAPLRFEPPDPNVPAEHDTGERFPHLYGALNRDAVLEARPYPPDADGVFHAPA